MILRAAPDGDEYDKDVATAIRYAVDNGAKVINMSIGKMTSPDSAMVSDAVGYALQHDVLLLQAAGNSHLNIDSVPYFPTGKNPEGVFYDNYIRVGASDKDGNPASMSNFGIREVDVFARGSPFAPIQWETNIWRRTAQVSPHQWQVLWQLCSVPISRNSKPHR